MVIDHNYSCSDSTTESYNIKDLVDDTTLVGLFIREGV